ncbi:unnamed protein product [Gadus morhua 'NCC']
MKSVCAPPLSGSGGITSRGTRTERDTKQSQGNKDIAGTAVTGEQGHSGDSRHRETRTERGQQTQGNKDRAGTADTGTRTERGQ